MSNVLYPLGLIESIAVEKMDRAIVDDFEDGTTASRRYWAAQNFKRRLQVAHTWLTPTEYRYLRSFFSQRSGQYDSFWFRDNINRAGNVNVRFSGPLREARGSAGAYKVSVQFDEIAPIRALPEWDEVVTAAGATPLFWYDANREYYLSHAGSVVTDPAVKTYDSLLAYPAPWQAGTPPIGNTLAQYQHYAFTGAEWARSAANVSGLTGTQPACTVFAIAKHGTVSAKQVLFGVGAMGAGKAAGIAVSAANYYEPWIGGSESWGTAKFENSAIDTWRSLAVTWAASSNNANLYVNGAAALTESETRAFETGPVALGSAIDGTLKASGNVAHAIAFAAALTQTQIKAIHNLLGYQYGLTVVA